MYGLQSPDFEVVIRVNASDVVVAAGFIAETDSIDLLLGVHNPTDVPRYQHLLAVVATGLNTQGWFSLDDLDLPEVDDEDAGGEIPF